MLKVTLFISCFLLPISALADQIQHIHGEKTHAHALPQAGLSHKHGALPAGKSIEGKSTSPSEAKVTSAKFLDFYFGMKFDSVKPFFGTARYLGVDSGCGSDEDPDFKFTHYRCDYEVMGNTDLSGTYKRLDEFSRMMDGSFRYTYLFFDQNLELRVMNFCSKWSFQGDLKIHKKNHNKVLSEVFKRFNKNENTQRKWINDRSVGTKQQCFSIINTERNSAFKNYKEKKKKEYEISKGVFLKNKL